MEVAEVGTPRRKKVSRSCLCHECLLLLFFVFALRVRHDKSIWRVWR